MQNTKIQKQNKTASENPKTFYVFGFSRRELSLRDNSAFSLVEMLVAIGIFMSIMTVSVSALISIMGANKKAQAIKSTVDSVTFALENISRDMRIGSGYKCSTPDVTGGKDCIVGSTAVEYTNSAGEGIEYKFTPSIDTSGVAVSELTKRKLSCATANCSVDLISKDSNVHIDNMTFYVIGADHELDSPITTKTQPRVIITASGFISAKGSANTTFNLQTNISQRIRR